MAKNKKLRNIGIGMIVVSALAVFLVFGGFLAILGEAQGGSRAFGVPYQDSYADIKLDSNLYDYGDVITFESTNTKVCSEDIGGGRQGRTTCYLTEYGAVAIKIDGEHVIDNPKFTIQGAGTNFGTHCGGSATPHYNWHSGEGGGAFSPQITEWDLSPGWHELQVELWVYRPGNSCFQASKVGTSSWDYNEFPSGLLDYHGAENFNRQPWFYSTFYVPPPPCTVDFATETLVVEQFTAGNSYSQSDMIYPVKRACYGQPTRELAADRDLIEDNYTLTKDFMDGKTITVGPSRVHEVTYITDLPEGFEVSCARGGKKYDAKSGECVFSSILKPCAREGQALTDDGTCIAISLNICGKELEYDADIDTSHCYKDPCKDLGAEYSFAEAYGGCGIRAKYSKLCDLPDFGYSYEANTCLGVSSGSCTTQGGLWNEDIITWKAPDREATAELENMLKTEHIEFTLPGEPISWVDGESKQTTCNLQITKQGAQPEESGYECDLVEMSGDFGNCDLSPTYNCPSGTVFNLEDKDSPYCMHVGAQPECPADTTEDFIDGLRFCLGEPLVVTEVRLGGQDVTEVFYEDTSAIVKSNVNKKLTTITPGDAPPTTGRVPGPIMIYVVFGIGIVSLVGLGLWLRFRK